MNKFFQLFDIKLWKFLLVGVINTLVGNGLQFILFNLTSLKQMEQKGTWIASTISYFCGAVLSYFLNKYFTFKNKEKGFRPIFRFAVNQIVCFGIAYGIAIPCISWLCKRFEWTMFGWSIDTFAGNVSMIIGSCLFVGLNYLGQRFYAFKEKNANADKPKQPSQNEDKNI